MSTYYKCSDKFITREIAGEILAVPVGIQDDRMNGFVTFSGTGGFFWKSLKTARTADELIDLVCAEYEATRDEVEQDVIDFLKNGIEAGMITATEA